MFDIIKNNLIEVFVLEAKWIHFRTIQKKCTECGKQMHLATATGKQYYWFHENLNEYASCCNMEHIKYDEAKRLIKKESCYGKRRG